MVRKLIPLLLVPLLAIATVVIEHTYGPLRGMIVLYYSIFALVYLMRD